MRVSPSLSEVGAAITIALALAMVPVTAAEAVQESHVLELPGQFAGLTRSGEVKRYSRENLYEYINGHAEFYLSAGFESLVGASYRSEDGRSAVVVDVYDMGRDLHAFGALMEGVGGSGQSVDLATAAFEVDDNLSFAAGRYLVKVIADGEVYDRPMLGAALLEALAIEAPAEIEVEFPDLGEVTRTTFVKENYKSLDFMVDVVERRFEIGDLEVTAFSTRGGEGGAAEVERRLIDFLAYDDIEVDEMAVGEHRVRSVHDPYEGEWFYAIIDGTFVGVFATPTPELVGRLFAVPAS